MTQKTRVLIVEDDIEFQNRYTNWLSNENYLLKISSSLKETELILESHYFDVAIIDMNLENDRRGGIEILRMITEIGDLTRKIIVSADVSREEVRDAQENYGASVLFKMELNRELLVNSINKELEQLSSISSYREVSLHKSLLKEKGLSDGQIFLISKNKPDLEFLLQSIFLELWPFNLKLPIVSQISKSSGDEDKYIIQISGWSRGLNSSIVLRLGSQKVIKIESDAYNDHMRHLTESFGTVKKGPFYHNALGGIIYVLSNTQFETVTDFNHFYQKEDATHVVESLNNIFHVIESLYQSRNIDRVNIDMSLANKKLIEQVGRYKKREANNKDIYVLNSIDEKINPLEFLLNHKFVFDNVPVAVVHGDLIGANIMVNSRLQIWLLGFYPTGSDESDVIAPIPANSDNVAFRARQAGKRNLLHDCVTLEVSIRRQLVDLSLKEITELDQALCRPRTLSEMPSFQIDFNNPTLNRAFQIIASLRKQVSEFVQFDNELQVYYSELLFQLIEIYLHPRNEAEKRNVYLSATVLADKLEKEYPF